MWFCNSVTHFKWAKVAESWERCSVIVTLLSNAEKGNKTAVTRQRCHDLLMLGGIWWTQKNSLLLHFFCFWSYIYIERILMQNACTHTHTQSQSIHRSAVDLSTPAVPQIKREVNMRGMQRKKATWGMSGHKTEGKYRQCHVTWGTHAQTHKSLSWGYLLGKCESNYSCRKKFMSCFLRM